MELPPAEHLLWLGGAFFALPLVALGLALTVSDRLRARTGRRRR